MKDVHLIAADTYWLGGSDRRLAMFENLFPIPRGVSYNSYLILDEKTLLLDTVDSAVAQPWLENLTALLAGRPLDYLVISHMEPDHCAQIADLAHVIEAVGVVGFTGAGAHIPGQHLKAPCRQGSRQTQNILAATVALQPV